MGLKRYLSMLLAFFRTSVVADMEYRANITAKILTDFLWYFAQLLTFEVLYQHTTTLGGWHLNQLRVFMTLLFVVDALYMIFFSENLDQIPYKVVRGEVDLLLAKPVDSQFMLSTMRMNTAYCVNIVLVTAAFFWALSQLDNGIPWARLPVLLVVIPSGVLVMYATRIIFSAASFFYGNTSQLTLLWFQFYRLGTRPDVLYPSWLRYVVLTILPMGFVASVPARLLVDEWSWGLPLASLAVGISSLAFSRWYWQKALRRYASASS